MANFDAVSGISHSHVQRGRLVKHRDVAVVDSNVPFRGVNIRLVT